MISSIFVGFRKFRAKSWRGFSEAPPYNVMDCKGLNWDRHVSNSHRASKAREGGLPAQKRKDAPHVDRGATDRYFGVLKPTAALKYKDSLPFRLLHSFPIGGAVFRVVVWFVSLYE